MNWIKKACCVPASGEPCVQVALIGNPNCGKSTLFNALTGSCQRVGNWPGVTVEKKSGCFTFKNLNIEMIDLPGVYSLLSNSSAIDERITCEFLQNNPVDLVINIIDASHLERHLYLTMQLLEMGLPVIIALNMMDVAHNRGLKIDLKQLEKLLNCPVIPVEARHGRGIEDLKLMMAKKIKSDAIPNVQISYPQVITNEINSFPHLTKWQTLALLEDNIHSNNPEIENKIKQSQEKIRQTAGEDADILIADARYCFIQAALKATMSKANKTNSNLSSKLDRFILNRVLGLPFFLLVMYSLFFFAINIGGAFQDFFDLSSKAIFVDGAAHIMAKLHAPAWLIALLANGVGKGINTVVTFIPVIGAMFLGLAFLEDSGYMARAAFVVDRVMRAFGLPGKSFVPMIVGFGCNVPAVMAARTLDNSRDRILTIMMTPFMSCSARLAIFAVFVTAFFPHHGSNIIFTLYLISILMAVVTGLLLRRTILPGKSSPLIMELPPYHIPKFKTLYWHAWQRLRGFVLRAGKLILPICIILGVLNSLHYHQSATASTSILAQIGIWMSPIFHPMGIDASNWPATVGLLTGILAKEVVIGTLNALYTQVDYAQAALSMATQFDFWTSIKAAIMTIPDNLAQLIGAIQNPIMAKAPVHAMSENIYGIMYQRFGGQLNAIAYLLFVLLYFPCVSTLAVMWREIGKSWACFSALWTTGIAYICAVLFYQIATFNLHPTISSIYVLAMTTVFLTTILTMRYKQQISGGVRV